MPKILLVGNDLRLLMTRSAVLARTSATVVYCNAIEAAPTLQNESFNLVVLCHSLTEKQISEITGMAHRTLPTATVLRVVSDLSREMPRIGSAFDATSTCDPDGLIRRTIELLRPVPSSAIHPAIDGDKTCQAPKSISTLQEWP